jgi:hypothetical protein
MACLAPRRPAELVGCRAFQPDISLLLAEFLASPCAVYAFVPNAPAKDAAGTKQ